MYACVCMCEWTQMQKHYEQSLHNGFQIESVSVIGNDGTPRLPPLPRHSSPEKELLAQLKWH